MATYLYRLGRLAARHAWGVVLVWLLLLALAATGAAALGKPFTGTMSIPGTEFQRVLDDLETSLPSAAGGLGTVVLSTEDGTPFTTEQKQAVSAVIARWPAQDGVEAAVDPFALQQQLDGAAQQVAQSRARLDAAQQGLTTQRAQFQATLDRLGLAGADADRLPTELATVAARLDAAEEELAANEADLRQGERRVALAEGLRTVSKAGNVAVAQVRFDQPINDVAQATKDAVVQTGDTLTTQGVRIDYSKEIVQNISVVGPGEAIGVAVAAIVLVVMLGSLLAAGLPLLTALIGVAVGLLSTVTLGHWFSMTNVTPALALMLGLAVGIDYSLFLVNRHRGQLALGVGLEESIGRATGTAGGAVLFAGLTVIVALAALTLTRIPFLATMGYVAAGTVAVAVLVALTLTPALLRLIGHRVLSPRSRRALAAHLAAEEAEAEAEDDRPAGHPTSGWGRLVTRRPSVTLLLATILLGTLAVPAASLRLGLPDGAYEPHDSTAYRTYAAIDENFGAGRNGPIIAVAALDATRAADLDEAEVTDLELTIAERLEAMNGVAYVVPFSVSDDRQRLAFQLVPTTGPSEDATAGLVNRLRDDAPALVAEQSLTSLGFTGQTVANIDISDALAGALPTYLAVVVGISLILLLLVFRSVVVPVLATAGFLLSIAAAFGAVVAVYQWGWLGSLFGVEQTGLVLSFLPTLVIGILFGLAMDYQMFLVTGMREAWAHGHAARTAVHTGFRHGARVVTAAALIMTGVFASFIHAQLTMVRPIGFALAVGVLIDAFVVRMTAMPAIMYLLGERAWYQPKWLNRLPDLDIEGTRLTGAAERHDEDDDDRSPASPVPTP